jgi:hypothetical protein
MAKRLIQVVLPLLNELRQVDREVAGLFEGQADPGLGCVGLILDDSLDDSRYWCTPTNCRTFASTGGNGVHFSLLVRDSIIDVNCRVVVTIPDNGGLTYFVGENLFDFLCLGKDRGYFALEQLSHDVDLVLRVFTDPYWSPSERWHEFVGYTQNIIQAEVLRHLTARLDLRSWGSSDRFHVLQDRYESLLELPTET